MDDNGGRKSDAKDAAADGSSNTGSMQRDLLGKMRAPVLVLTILSLIGSVGSALGIVFAARSIQWIAEMANPGPFRWHVDMAPYVVGAFHASVMAIAYAIVAWHLMKYARILAAVLREPVPPLREFLGQQRLLFWLVACVGIVYIATRVAGSILVTTLTKAT